MDVLKTNNKKCLICKTGDIVEKNRSNTKDGFMVGMVQDQLLRAGATPPTLTAVLDTTMVT